MGLFDKLKEPIFLKESSDAKGNIEKLKLIYQSAPDDVKQMIDQDLKFLSYGIFGEDQIAFELRNSHMPMYILHDLYLEDEGLSAQIDYLAITKKCIFVIECKNLFGNIEINSNGDFIRTLEFNGKFKKEGIYSPITQNKRHLELIKQIRGKSKSNFITKSVFENSFYSNYRSVVVLANPKTVLNAKYAKREIKDQVIRADQLIEHMKKINYENSSISAISDKDMEEIAGFFLSINKSNPKDYCEKYQVLINEKKTISEKEEHINQTVIGNEIDKPANINYKELLIKNLKQFRLNKSREEDIKPYFIFNDNQMMDLIDKMPKNIEELKNVSGFGDAKCNKYGGNILAILNNL